MSTSVETILLFTIAAGFLSIVYGYFTGKNIFIAESGIKNRNDLIYLKSNGINTFLIGESLMSNNF